MGLLSSLLLRPVKGPGDSVFWVARKLAEQVEKERNSTIKGTFLAPSEDKLIRRNQ